MESDGKAVALRKCFVSRVPVASVNLCNKEFGHQLVHFVHARYIVYHISFCTLGIPSVQAKVSNYLCPHFKMPGRSL